MNEESNAKESVFKKTEHCSQSRLRNVIQLHKKDEICVPSTEINMEKAFKGFGIPSHPSKPSSNNLPLCVLYAIGSSTGKPEKEFLEKRRQDWVDSFIVYILCSEFVALFVGAEINSKEKKKRSFNASLSISTRKLRSLLKKKGVGFSMPLSSKEEEEESEDLEEILEARSSKKKSWPGNTFRFFFRN